MQALTNEAEATIKRDRDPHVKHSELKHEGEPSLRYMAEMWAKDAERLERAAAIARGNARLALEHPRAIDTGTARRG
jgi:hypothetical protein